MQSRRFRLAGTLLLFSPRVQVRACATLFNTGKMVVCLCPTIALIHSQVTDLVNKGIDAVAFGKCAGEDAVKNRSRDLNQDETGVPALVYTTPETFEKELHLLKKRKDKIKMIVRRN